MQDSSHTNFSLYLNFFNADFGFFSYVGVTSIFFYLNISFSYNIMIKKFFLKKVIHFKEINPK